MSSRPSLRSSLLFGLALFFATDVFAVEKIQLSDDPVTARRNLVEQSLHLDPSKAARFWPLYESYQKELDHYRTLRLELLSSMGENYDNMSEADAHHIIEERIKIEQGRGELLIRTVEKMGKVLSQRELARFVQIELKIKAFIDAGIEEEIPILQ